VSGQEKGWKQKVFMKNLAQFSGNKDICSKQT
jgi:hypothetical protein